MVPREQAHKSAGSLALRCRHKGDFELPFFLAAQGKQGVNLAEGEVLFFFFSCFLGLPLRHMEVLRLGVALELQFLPFAMATAMQDLS